MALKNSEEDVKSNFMQRWSDRKIASQDVVVDEPEIELTAEVDAELEHDSLEKNISTESTVAEKDVQALKTDADMPPVDALTEESNFSDFLSPEVSDALRKQALRKLFHLPFFNIVDGLDDYAEDYTKFAPLGDIIPHDMKRMFDREKQREIEKLKEQEELKKQEELNNSSLEQTEDEKASELESSSVTESEAESISAAEEIIDNDNDNDVQFISNESINLNERSDHEKRN